MRLFLLPISTRRSLIYCERQVQQIPTAQQPYIDRITNKANTTWTDWEKADSGWKRKVTGYGNKMFRRIPFEEWGLKSIPPLKASRNERKVAAGLNATSTTAADEKEEVVEVKFPGAFQGLGGGESVRQVLERIGTERQELHRKRMWYSLLGLPIALPFGLLPIVPNIPFFYLTFRAWSHWRALRGSQHLQHLLSKNLLKLAPSATLDQLYTAGLIHSDPEESRAAPHPTQKQIKDLAARVQRQAATEKKEVMVLRPWNAKLVAEMFKLPALEVEIERAVEQVMKGISAEEELKEEKTEIDGATEKENVAAEANTKPKE